MVPPAAGVWEPTDHFQLDHFHSALSWAITAMQSWQYNSWDNVCTVLYLQLFRKKKLPTPSVARWKFWNCLFHAIEPMMSFSFHYAENKAKGSSTRSPSALLCLRWKGNCSWQGWLDYSCLWLPGFFSTIMVAKYVQNTVTQWGKWDFISLKLEKNVILSLWRQLPENQIHSILFLRLGRFWFCNTNCWEA